MKNSTGFFGTYFDRDVVLRLERWVRIVAWGVLLAYLFEAGYNVYQNIYNSIINGFMMDPYFFINTMSRIFVGGALFILLQVAGQVMLILMDIEDNTRRAARGNSKES